MFHRISKSASRDSRKSNISEAKRVSRRRILGFVKARLSTVVAPSKSIPFPLALLLALRSAILHFWISYIFDVRFNQVESLQMDKEYLPVVFAAVQLIT
jgi:hypothetical protein